MGISNDEVVRTKDDGTKQECYLLYVNRYSNITSNV